MRMKLVGLTVLSAPFIVMIALGYMSRQRPPPLLPATATTLPPCPTTPNCVSSNSSSPSARVAPITLTRVTSEPRNISAETAVLETAVVGIGGKVVEQRVGYLRAEFRSTLFGFVDDLDLMLNPSGDYWDVRSASRIGHSDLGANRARVEALRSKLPNS